MSKPQKTELQKVSEETMRFMRGKYTLDEMPWRYKDIDSLKFRQGNKTILSIYIYDDYYDFQIIYGKAERAKFEEQRDTFPQHINELYDNARTYHDGKWMMIRVEDLDTLEAVKKMIVIKKKPNRKPFPKDTAIYSKCGMRCDLCAYYTGDNKSEEAQKELIDIVMRVYGEHKYSLCKGCHTKDTSKCGALDCARSKGLESCLDCADYPCGDCGLVTCGIGVKELNGGITANDITWGVLPYVDGQYGN